MADPRDGAAPSLPPELPRLDDLGGVGQAAGEDQDAALRVADDRRSGRAGGAVIASVDDEVLVIFIVAEIPVEHEDESVAVL